MSNFIKERNKLKLEIQLCKNLLLKNVTSVGSNHINGSSIPQHAADNPLATLYLIENISGSFLPPDHKINTTLKGIKQGAEVIESFLSS